MGFRFRKSIKIAPGVRLNFGRKSSSISFGTRGFHTTISKNGVRSTAGIPGTGMSYTDYKSFNGSSNSSVPRVSPEGIPYTPQCPYCGHKMRKAWTSCPQCHGDLMALYMQPEPSTAPPNDYTNPVSTNPASNDTSNGANQQKPSSAMGCLIWIIIIGIIYWLFFA